MRNVTMLGCSAIGVVAGWMLHAGMKDSPTSLSFDTAQLVAVRNEITEVRRLVENFGQRLAPQEGPPQVVQATRLPADERDVSKFSSTLERLENLINALTAQVRFQNGLQTSMPPQNHAKDEAAVSRILNTYVGREKTAVRDHFCWTASDVYAEFGQPDDVTQNGSNIQWSYYGPEHQSGIMLTFNGGVVWYEDVTFNHK